MDAVSFIQTLVWINEALLVEVLYTMKYLAESVWQEFKCFLEAKWNLRFVLIYVSMYLWSINCIYYLSIYIPIIFFLSSNGADFMATFLTDSGLSF